MFGRKNALVVAEPKKRLIMFYGTIEALKEALGIDEIILNTEKSYLKLQESIPSERDIERTVSNEIDDRFDDYQREDERTRRRDEEDRERETTEIRDELDNHEDELTELNERLAFAEGYMFAARFGYTLEMFFSSETTRLTSD